SVKKAPPGGGEATGPVPPVAPVAAPPPAPGPTLSPRLAPVAEQAQLFREAADQLIKAGTMLDNGNKNLAEQLFSTAELLAGADGLASLAPLFRDGAPPRITTPTQKVDPAAARQPVVVGNSEDDD